MTRISILLAGLVLCACHTTFDLTGDTSADPGVDPRDTSEDTAVDRVPEIPGEPVLDPPVPDAVTPCPPPMDDEEVYFQIGDEWWEEVDIELVCSVDEPLMDPGTESWNLVLSCMHEDGTEEIFVIVLRGGSGFHLESSLWGGDVVLRYIAGPIWWTNRWFTIRTLDGGLILAGVDAEHLAPYEWAPAEWYHPLDVRLLEHVCEPEEEHCGLLRRQAIEVELEGHGVEVYDHCWGAVGPWEAVHIFVGSLHEYVRMDCDDVPYTWVSAVFLMLS